MSLDSVLREPLITPVCMRTVAKNIMIVWRRKEATMVPRRRIPRKRQACEKKKQPRQKHTIDVKDLAHPYGFEVRCPVLPPKPIKMVFPV